MYKKQNDSGHGTIKCCFSDTTFTNLTHDLKKVVTEYSCIDMVIVFVH